MTTVIVKPTDGCNARCRYCSAAHPGAARTMGGGTLRAVFDLLAAWALRAGDRRISFIWHGGEPLLMPDTFWEMVLAEEAERLSSRGIAVENRIQSNLTLLTPDRLPLLARLLGKTGVVGTSFDPLPGIRELAGAGEYERRWKDAVKLLRENGIRYGIIYVVHRRSLPDLHGIYERLRGENPDVGLRFNPLYRQGRAGSGETWEELGIAAEEWGDALIALDDAWRRDGRPANVQPFGPWWRLAAGGRWRLSCECSGRCVATHFGVDPAGNFHVCGRSADGGVFNLGPAARLTPEALEDHPERRALSNRAAYLRLTTCRECAYWRFCHGGCINDAMLEAGTPFAPTSWCAGLKRLFSSAPWAALAARAPGDAGARRPARSSAARACATVRVADCPSVESALAAVRRLSWGGSAVDIEDVGRLRPREVSRLIGGFLHDPAIVSPVEPFSSILEALVRRRPFSPWDLALRRGERRVDGRSEVLERLPAERPGCLACRAFPLCSGYAASEGSCDTWRTILGALSAAARELRTRRRRSRPTSRAAAEEQYRPGDDREDGKPGVGVRDRPRPADRDEAERAHENQEHREGAARA